MPDGERTAVVIDPRCCISLLDAQPVSVPEQGDLMSTFQLTFDAPRQRGGAPSDDVLNRLSRCPTLGEVHREFGDVSSILGPIFGPASAHGATRTLVRSFARLLQHPLGPSVAAEALALAVAAKGLLASPALAEFFDQAMEATSSRRPLAAGVRLLIREPLERVRSPRRRLAQLIEWWVSAHEEGGVWTFQATFVPRADAGYWGESFELDPMAWLALAPAALLMDQVPWMSAAGADALARHPLLFDGREDIDQLGWLVAHHPTAVVENPGCPEVVSLALRRFTVPTWCPPELGQSDVGQPVERWEWAHGRRRELQSERARHGVRLGWLSVPATRNDWMDSAAFRALIPAAGRPVDHLVHAAGRIEVETSPPDETTEQRGRRARLLADALHGKTFSSEPEWKVMSLMTDDAIYDNAKYMGNCTARYYGPPEETGTILCSLSSGGERLNASVRWDEGAGWVVGAIDSRFNGGDVTSVVREQFAALVVRASARTETATSRTRTNLCVECKSLLVAVGKVCEPCKGDDEHP